MNRSSGGCKKSACLASLDREQFQTLYAEWQDRYAAKAAQDRKRGVANIMTISDETRARMCSQIRSCARAAPCSMLHQLHYAAAKAARQVSLGILA
jgi:hypothetical protein